MSRPGQLQSCLQWPKLNGRRWQSDYTMTKLGKLFFCLWASEWKRELFLFSFLGQEQICVQHKGYVDKVEKKYTGKWEKLCREQCETDSILQLDHTMIQCFFYSLFICILWNDCMPLFRGLFGKTLWLCFSFCQLITFYIKKTLLSTNKLGTRYFMAVIVILFC